MLRPCRECVHIAASDAGSRVLKIFAKSAIRYVLTALVVTQLCGYGAYAQTPTPTPTPMTIAVTSTMMIATATPTITVAGGLTPGMTVLPAIFMGRR
jgi:hypothetical protein